MNRHRRHPPTSNVSQLGIKADAFLYRIVSRSFPHRFGSCAQYFAVTTPWLDRGFDLRPPGLEHHSLFSLSLCQHSGTISSLLSCLGLFPGLIMSGYIISGGHIISPQSHDIAALRACLPWLPTLCMPQQHFSWTVATAYVSTLSRHLRAHQNSHGNLPQSCRQFRKLPSGLSQLLTPPITSNITSN